MHTEKHKQVHLGDVVRRANEEIRSWPAWAQPFRPSVRPEEKTRVGKTQSRQREQPSSAEPPS
jgi:hypothetical protein